ncbi:MAG: hypothetical protein Q7S27_01610 [Nanoarchaeota archaeon]|nr:hypothetical protein [Nanoarchaeota archaeon]
MNSKGIIQILGYSLIFVNIFFLNVIVHEIGHYLTAEHYNLEPEIEFDFGSVGDSGFGFSGTPIASTSFNEPNNGDVLAAIVLTGPLFNLILGVIFFMIFVFYRDNEYIREVVIIGFIVSISSFLMNLIPIEGSDGSLLLGLI